MFKRITIMRIVLPICFLVFLSTSCTVNNPTKEISAKEFQDDLAKEYSGVDSPLKEDDLKNFKGLDFFPVNDDYKVTALFEKLTDGEIITMKTSKNLAKQYKKYGKISFSLQGKPLQLFVYQSYPVNKKYKDHLFLPFMDETTGSTSYGAGRYIDLSVKDSKDGILTVDFNKSYNPYCAYSKHYNCPLTPYENTLDVPVEAGIRYNYSDYEK